MKNSFVKKAPYTILMIACVTGFWGYKAVDAATTESTVTETADSNEPIPVRTDELAMIDAVLGEVTPSAENQNESGNGESGASDLNENTVADNKAEQETESGLEAAGENESGTEGAYETESSSDTGENNELNKTEGGENYSGASESGVSESGEVTGEETKEYPYPYCLGTVENNCVVYDQKEVDSLYYKDCGKIALDTVADYSKVDDSYFEDACFVGDSRMVGIYDYAGWDKADFYCDNGYCLYNFKGGKTVICQNNGKKYTLEDAMKRKQYGKVYIMMGTNDCGYGNTESFKQNYSDMLEMIKKAQPNAVIFAVSNMRISKKAEKEDKTGVYTNLNINDKNVAISELADGERVFYFDCNPPFVDENGYLIEEDTFDGFHVYARQYSEMAELFKAHGIKN
ncbi:MAG: hypothetical protein K5669_08915 [Lachnospiraceae bacterium]|nr:hypothetical protein [Lachnospiraceae bacterium]